MLWRRAILGTAALVLAILAAQVGQVSTSAEDKGEAPSSSESQAESRETSRGDLPDTPRVDEETIEIPLDQIWAYRMPGTRNIEKLDGPFVLEVRRSLWPFPSKEKEAREGFAVRGTGLKALREVHAVLVEKKNPQQDFPTNIDISVFFFAYPEQPYVHLHRVERQADVVDIRYRFVPNENEETSEHFAIIPLGTLMPGKYRVNVIRSPMEKAYRDKGFRSISDAVARRIVCGSFSFSVSERGD